MSNYFLDNDGHEYVRTFRGNIRRFNGLGEEFDMFDMNGNPVYGCYGKKRNASNYGLLFFLGLGGLLFL